MVENTDEHIHDGTLPLQCNGNESKYERTLDRLIFLQFKFNQTDPRARKDPITWAFESSDELRQDSANWANLSLLAASHFAL